MEIITMIVTVIFVIITSSVVDGGFEKTVKDIYNLQKDINAFKKIAEKIDEDLKVFYGEFSQSDITKDDAQTIDQKHIEGAFIQQRNKENNILHKVDRMPSQNKTTATQFAAEEKYISKDKTIASITTTYNSISEQHTSLSPTWPKFEDILLAIGKRYDWKNDRWIKVKEKLNLVSLIKETSAHVHHNFSYRLVKLNKSKKKRNIVIAVSDVR